MVAQAGRSSFRAYVTAMNRTYRFYAFHKLLASVLQGVIEGRYKRVILCVPPRHGKSEQSSVHLPASFLGHYPDKHVIGASYGKSLADTFSRRVRGIVDSPMQQLFFPNCEIASDNNRKDQFNTTAGGSFRGVGFDGGFTGLGADLALIDDAHKNRKEAESATMRQDVWDNFTSGIYTRLSPTGAIVIIGARWNSDDLIGRCLRDLAHEKWKVINLPAIDLDDDGNEVALWPERWPVDKLNIIKQTIGAYDWASLYQQRPTPSGGSYIKQEWLKYYKAGNLPPVIRFVWSWDTAVKAKQRNDFSVGLLWAVCANGFYLVRMVKQKMEYPELRARVKMEFDGHKAHVVLIEDKSSGQQLLQDMRRDTTIPVVAVNPPADKAMRVNLAAPTFEAGKVFLPEGEPWLVDYVQELCGFPSEPHDDIVDATTQFIARELSAPRPRVMQL